MRYIIDLQLKGIHACDGNTFFLNALLPTLSLDRHKAGGGGDNGGGGGEGGEECVHRQSTIKPLINK